ncbi:MAG: hypothetical protein IJZ39_02650 [Oscillospiraceae bacterium]|nr:hypothetical protein [Oscillospiraceae bacterium]
MISEFFLNIVFNIVSSLLDMLPDVTISPDTSVFGYFIGILKVACYLLPMDTVGTICGLIVTFTIVRAVIALIKTIWDLLPLV